MDELIDHYSSMPDPSRYWHWYWYHHSHDFAWWMKNDFDWTLNDQELKAGITLPVFEESHHCAESDESECPIHHCAWSLCLFPSYPPPTPPVAVPPSPAPPKRVRFAYSNGQIISTKKEKAPKPLSKRPGGARPRSTKAVPKPKKAKTLEQRRTMPHCE